MANFESHSGQISALSFSENGYYLATAADDACIRLWDLRKLKNFKTIQLDEGYEVKDLCFDQVIDILILRVLHSNLYHYLNIFISSVDNYLAQKFNIQ